MTRPPLDPELRAIAAVAAAQPPMRALTVAQARERAVAGAAVCRPGPATPTAHHEIEVGGGRIGVREYRGNRRGDRVLVYFHGGGWVVGDLDTCDGLCRHLAVTTGATVLSVDYRLAPEHPFPTPVRDAWAALRWAADRFPHAGGLVVGGDSAGGTLAAACALLARDAGGPALTGQLLLYPVLDCDLGRPSYVADAEAFPLTTADMRWFWDHYAPDPAVRTQVLASPLRAVDLAGLPPTLLVQAGHDPLRDEGAAYAARLAGAGVEVTTTVHPTLGHGFVRFTAVSAAVRTAVARTVAAATALFVDPSGAG